MYVYQHTREMAPLLNGQQVCVLNHEKKEWFPAKVISQNGDRSYCVQTESGRQICLNRRQLREITHTTGQITTEPIVAFSANAAQAVVEKIVRPEAVPADTVPVKYQENVQSMTHTRQVNMSDGVARPTTNACEAGRKESMVTTRSGRVVCRPHRYEL